MRIPDHHTRCAAQRMVERFGADAAAQADHRAATLLAVGDRLGAAACRAMMLTINELQREARPAAGS